MGHFWPFFGWVAQFELQLCCMTIAFRFDGLDTPHAYLLAHFGLFWPIFWPHNPCYPTLYSCEVFWDLLNSSKIDPGLQFNLFQWGGESGQKTQYCCGEIFLMGARAKIVIKV